VPGLYPPVEPFDHGRLDVGDGNLVYWEVCGHPEGKPAVVLHGGPGSGCSPAMRRFFDPGAYRVVLLDQRGCGRSTPHASDPATDLSVNTTEHLLGDLERLRLHLGIDGWLVLGSSWGSTLGLAYAERHPERVSELVLVGVTTTRRAEIDWLYRGVGLRFPEAWARFRAGVPPADRDGDLVEAYHRLLESPDPGVRAAAARAWTAWEWALSSVEPPPRLPPPWSDPDFQLARARIVTHYFRHGAWLEEGQLLRHAGALAGIAGVLVNGGLDAQSPVDTASELARRWPDADLVVVGGAGHSTGDPGMAEAVVRATDRFAGHR
jgi:proline iminopeptidase